MRYFTITKRGIFIAGIMLLATVMVIAVFSNRSVKTNAVQSDKIVPIYCVSTEEKKIAITFDAAWGADDTNELIGILGEYNAKATFFVVGDWARKYPDSIKAFYAAGHEIGNHSDKHTAYSKLSADEIKADIALCNEAVKNATGVAPVLIRAPSGDYTDTSETACAQSNMRTVQWSVDSLDWQGLEKDEIVKRVVSAADCGSIILFHNDVKNTPAALKEILSQLSQKGYSFVTVSELIYQENYSIDSTGKQIKNS